MYTYLKTLLTAKLSKSEKGQDLAEYALLVALIAIVVIAAVRLLGTNVSAIFSGMTFS